MGERVRAVGAQVQDRPGFAFRGQWNAQNGADAVSDGRLHEPGPAVLIVQIRGQHGRLLGQDCQARALAESVLQSSMDRAAGSLLAKVVGFVPNPELVPVVRPPQASRTLFGRDAVVMDQAGAGAFTHIGDGPCRCVFVRISLGESQ